MAINVNLQWVDYNPYGDGFEIYRNGTSFTKDQLPASPVTTVPFTTRSYKDTDVVDGTGYWYMVVLIIGTTKTYSDAVYHVAKDDGV